MFTKGESMSMATCLEGPTPLLDYDIVDFAFSLQADFKLNNQGRKRRLQDASRSQMRPELYNRGKQGFEVP